MVGIRAIEDYLQSLVIDKGTNRKLRILLDQVLAYLPYLWNIFGGMTSHLLGLSPKIICNKNFLMCLSLKNHQSRIICPYEDLFLTIER